MNNGLSKSLEELIQDHQKQHGSTHMEAIPPSSRHSPKSDAISHVFFTTRHLSLSCFATPWETMHINLISACIPEHRPWARYGLLSLEHLDHFLQFQRRPNLQNYKATQKHHRCRT
ncbi:hypothetical protein KC19_2G242100 [Ceratodon purpureus]|uniref:Uncharacterized protein n=1 Tax=Ceratodon purpureus TaxID=3225 RepID=A0A8T0IXF7_CERPU|nr:hypothetical protein KC19_2G242100 [Ceratodon purpureus]